MSNPTEQMLKCVDHLAKIYRGMSVGKATPALIENLQAKYHKTMVPIGHLAAIAAPRPLMLVIRPYSSDSVDPIKRALQAEGFNPDERGNILRVLVPSLSEEQRLAHVKRAKAAAERQRVAIRHVRRAAIKDDLDKEKADALTKDYIRQIDSLLDAKTAELMDE